MAMCGIAGFFSESGLSHNQFLISASDNLRHRGPDDEGFILLNREGVFTECFGPDSANPGMLPMARPIADFPGDFQAGMLHRRLSILVTDANGHQPMAAINRKVWISFNGEIYNYLEIKKELQLLGCVFQTRTDTEVLLQAWIHWGENCLSKLDGMFAFSVLDLERQLFFLATDHAGIKPIYYRQTPKGFFYASEIKVLSGISPPVSPSRKEVCRFLANGQSDETEKTMFAGIYRLTAGHCLSIPLSSKSCKPEIRQWNEWNLNNSIESNPEDFQQKRSSEIRDIFQETLRLRLQADVPLGICLSGGLDSSAIAGFCAAADKGLGNQEKRKAFMAVLPSGSPGDEFPFARKMATASGFELFTTSPDPGDFIESLPDLIRTLDEPPPGMNAFSQYSVFKLVAENGVKVSLDGQGADEIFAGYPRHLEAGLLEQILHGGYESGLQPHFSRMMVNLFRGFLPGDSSVSLLKYLKPEYAVFREDVLREAASFDNSPIRGINQTLLYDFKSGILPFLLKAADRNSMRWSVESRMPFADSRKLVQHLFSIPGNAKIREGRSKVLLRDAASEFVPNEILSRRDKVGFAAPNNLWLSHLLRSDYVRSLPECPEFLDQSAFEKYAARFLQNPENQDASILWRLIAFRVWHSIFF